MKRIERGKVLIISDIHQSIGGYVEPILDHETDWDYIILNGDYFDTNHKPDGAIIYGMSQTCAWINEKFEEWGDKAIWHCGNHDISYFASYKKDFTKINKQNHYFCSGWTRSKAKYFSKEINPKWVESVKLCTQLGNNTVVSHAGFNYDHFKPYISELDNIEWYYNEWENDKHSFHYQVGHWIWDVGQCRGGLSTVGSPVWLDWGSEFTPIDNVSQIVGHTSSRCTTLRSKMSGAGLDNYCIDNMQQTYAIWEDGEFTFKILNISGD